MTLLETFEFLCSFHRRAPFLFFNGNTFAETGRQLTAILFADLPPGRRRECVSVVGHFIAGVLQADSLEGVLQALCENASFKPGDRVMTLRGTLKGKIVRLLSDGRIVWLPDDARMEMTSLPESLRPVG